MRPFISILTVLLVFSITVSGQYGTPQAKNETLLVKGTGILKQIPETFYALINVKSESRSYSDCQNILIVRTEKVKSSLINQNINPDLIRTNEITIKQKQEYINGKMEYSGFLGNVSLSIESPYSSDIANKLMLGLKSDSLITEYHIGFRLSEEQKSKIRQQAITMAIADAKEKALQIAKSSNVKLLRIISITYSDEDYNLITDADIVKEEILPSQYASVRIAGNNSNGPNIDFNPKEIGIVKTVRIEWNISDNAK